MLVSHCEFQPINKTDASLHPPHYHTPDHLPSSTTTSMPNFGPLSTERPDLQALSTSQALTAIRREICSSVLQIAPPKPLTRPPHKGGHYETGPHLWFEPDRCFNLGRWYQIVRF
jgi:hypothetical protein